MSKDGRFLFWRRGSLNGDVGLSACLLVHLFAPVRNISATIR